MEVDRSSRVLLGVSLGSLGSLLVATLLVGIRGPLGNVNVALVMVIVILAAATVGGRPAGAMSGLVAAMSFDFFHTRPYGLLKILSPNDLVTTALLLVVGLTMGEAVERSSRFKDRWRDDEQQLHRLHRVATSVASGEQDHRDLVLAVSAELVDTLRLDDCRFELPPFLDELPHLGANGAIVPAPRGSTRRGYELSPRGTDLRVSGPRGTVGRFVLLPAAETTVSTERLLVAVALARALGLALTPAAS